MAVYDTHALAWAAGFFDGEGCSYTVKDGKKTRPRLSISQNHREVLDRFNEAVGLGSVSGPHRRKGANPQWRYQVSGFEQVQQVIVLLWPWLGTEKREQYRRVWEDADVQHRFHSPRCRRGHVYAEVGRTKWGQCRGCLKITEARRDRRLTPAGGQ